MLDEHDKIAIDIKTVSRNSGNLLPRRKIPLWAIGGHRCCKVLKEKPEITSSRNAVSSQTTKQNDKNDIEW